MTVMKLRAKVKEILESFEGEMAVDKVTDLFCMPGEFHCPICGLTHHERVISAQSGAVGVRKEQLPQVCTNGCGMMDRVTWEEGFKETTVFLDGRLKEEYEGRHAILALEAPWPLADVLKTLARAVDHLQNDHNCDHLGYELTQIAAGRAREIREIIKKQLEGKQPPKPLKQPGFQKPKCKKCGAPLDSTTGDLCGFCTNA